MPASDWLRSVYSKGSDYSEEEMAENLLNARSFVDTQCRMTVEQGFNLLNSEKFRCYRYKLNNDSIYVSFLDKTATSHKMWRLAYFSYNTQNVGSQDIIGVIVRAIIEFMREQYAGKIENQGEEFLGLYYYTPVVPERDRPIMLQVLDQVNEILMSTNYNNYVVLSRLEEGNLVRYTLTYKQ